MASQPAEGAFYHLAAGQDDKTVEGIGLPMLLAWGYLVRRLDRTGHNNSPLGLRNHYIHH
jgi:hypothetical protein